MIVNSRNASKATSLPGPQMGKISIPIKISALLEKSTFAPQAKLACQQFEPWLSAFGTSPPLFPEYTDHGPDHISAVLAAAELLIPDAVWGEEVLTPDDAVLLVLSSLLHDVAMHLTPEGF